MSNAHFTELEDYRDLESLNFEVDALRMGMSREALLAGLAARSRDNGRTPVPWDASPNAGFTTGTPWIGLTPGWEHVNVTAQEHDPGSVLAHYRRLVALRKGRDGRAGLVADITIDGDYELLMPDHNRLWAFVRTLPTQDGEVTGRSILLVANFSSEDLGVDLPASLGDGLTTRLYAAFDAWYHRQRRRRPPRRHRLARVRARARAGRAPLVAALGVGGLAGLTTARPRARESTVLALRTSRQEAGGGGCPRAYARVGSCGPPGSRASPRGRPEHRGTTRSEVSMGVDDIINKAKDALGGEEGIEEKIEQAREFIKDKTPDNIDGLVDKAADAARNAVDTDGK